MTTDPTAVPTDPARSPAPVHDDAREAEREAEAALVAARRAHDAGRPDEAARRLDDLLAAFGDAPSPPLAEALFLRATLHLRAGRHADAARDLRQSGELHLLLGDRAGHARCLNRLGLAQAAAGDYAPALHSLTHCLEFLRAHDLATDGLLGACLVNLGRIYHELGDAEKALESLRRGVEIVEQTGGPQAPDVREGLAAGHAEIGRIHRERGDAATALQAFERALDVLRAGGATLDAQADLLGHVGLAHLQAGDVARGRGALEEALRLATDADHPAGRAVALVHLGSLHVTDGRPGEAVALLGEALDLADAVGLRRPALEAREQLARALLALGRAGEAAEHLLAVAEGQRDLFRHDNERQLRNLTGRLELERARHEADVYRRLNESALQARQDAELEVRARTADLETAQLETVNRLGLAAEYRDDKTGLHTYRVGHIAALLAEALGLPPERVELVRLAARLHDVGKIGIPDAILLKPGGYSPEEFEIMKHHTTIGARVLQGGRTELMRLAEQIALTHHEHWDGRGYPHGLAGEQIPLVGRIVAVADVWDALTTERPYKPAWTVEQALEELRAQAGRQFDPAVVEAFIRLAASGGLQRLDHVGEDGEDGLADAAGGLAADAPLPSLSVPAEVVEQIDGLVERAWQGRYQDPETLVRLSQEALDLAAAHGYVRGVGFACRNLALARIFQNDLNEAMALLTKASLLAEQHTDFALKRDCAVQLSLVHNLLLNSERALAYSLESLELSRALADRSGEAKALANLGVLYRTMEGHVDQALASLGEARRIHEALGNPDGAAICTANIADVHYERGAYPEAIHEGRAGQALAEATGNLVIRVQSVIVVARALEALGRWNEALPLFEAAWAEVEPVADHFAELATWTALHHAQGLLTHGHPNGAERLEAALTLAERHDFKRIALEAHRTFVKVFRERGRPEEAMAHQDAAHALELAIFRQENTQRALALSIEHHAERARAEAEAYKHRTLELASANVALEQANREKTALLAALQEQAHVLERQSREDGLTGVHNRRFIEELLAREFARHRAARRPLAVLVIDIDHFKRVNDEFSHPVGDEVLRHVAKLLRGACRPEDLVGRYGGEEFLVVLPNTGAEQGAEVAERVRAAVEQHPWTDIHPELRVTLSVGVCARTDVANHERMLSLADGKLYEAKRAGRNLVAS